jgi:1-acyl-sn-glycerol-3-phosphate acyltransferase
VAQQKPKRSAWYAFVRSFVRNTFFRTFGGIKTVGESNIPLEGPVIFAPNHVSNLDPPIIACSQNRRQTTFMAKEELFKVPVLGPIIHSLGAFKVRRGEGDTESIRKALGLLEEGRALLVFPEGARGDGKSLQPINRGVAMLAKRSGAQVVPVGIAGTHIVLPKGRSKPKRHRMQVTYGQPFTYVQFATHANEAQNRDAFAEKLLSEISMLCSQGGLQLSISSEPERSAQA